MKCEMIMDRPPTVPLLTTNELIDHRGVCWPQPDGKKRRVDEINIDMN